MRIVIDMQAVQSISRNRGIGRYSKSLVSAIVRNKGNHEVFLLFNGIFQLELSELISFYEEPLGANNIKVWYPLDNSSYLDGNLWKRGVTELIREHFIQSLNPDAVLICSLFEGLNDAVTATIGKLNSQVPVFVILYDLIPLIHSKHYLQNDFLKGWYSYRLDNIKKADYLLAISESSRLEAIDNINFAAEKVFNISAAIDESFSQFTIDSDRSSQVLNKYKIIKNYIMYTGGIDFRKNVDGLIRAYAEIPNHLRSKFQLIIVCDLGNNKENYTKLIDKFGLAKDEVVFTDFVPDDDLAVLYSSCYCFVFPSWHEGFGLPVLEAMSFGRAVIGSNLTSIPEVIGNAEALFDPHDVESISKLLKRVLTDDSFRLKLEQHSEQHSKNFSWDISAKKAITAIEQVTSLELAPEQCNYEQNLDILMKRISNLELGSFSKIELVMLAKCIAKNFP